LQVLSRFRVPFDAVGVVYEAHMERGVTDSEVLERREIHLVGSSAWDRHMHEIDAPTGFLHADVGEGHTDFKVFRFEEVPVVQIAITQM